MKILPTTTQINKKSQAFGSYLIKPEQKDILPILTKGNDRRLTLLHKALKNMFKEDKIGYNTYVEAMNLLNWKTICITKEELAQLERAESEHLGAYVKYFVDKADEVPDNIYQKASEFVQKAKDVLLPALGL